MKIKSNTTNKDLPWRFGLYQRPWSEEKKHADLHGRRALCSASSSRLVVPVVRLSTVGSRTLSVSGPRIWNGLPEDVVRCQHFQVSGVDLNPSSSNKHTRILSSNCTFDTIVVLVVMFIT